MSCFGPEIFMKIVHAKSQSLWLEVGYPQFCHFSAVMHVTLVLSFILTKLKKVELWNLSWYKLRHAGTKCSLFHHYNFHRFYVAPPQTLKNGVRIVMHVTRNGPNAHARRTLWKIKNQEQTHDLEYIFCPSDIILPVAENKQGRTFFSEIGLSFPRS